MKKLLLLFLLVSSTIVCQTNTAIYVFDIEQHNETYQLTNQKKISNSQGYNSQPFFYDDEQITFASTHYNFTDIVLYNLQNDSKRFISNTENGGEYSPQRIPNSNTISAVRLDADGLQRFYEYDFTSGKDKEIIADLKVAYPNWFDKNTLLAVSIVNDSLELFISDIKKKTSVSMTKNVGRSVHRIPNSDLMSFISKENKSSWVLKSINPKTQEIKTITGLGKSEDITWLPNGTLLISNENSIYKFNPKKDKNPSLFFRFMDENINNISRMAVNDDGSKIAIVAEVSPEYLAKEQLAGYNNRDIEAFLKPFAKGVKVYRFPNTLRYEGLENMRKNYTSFFENTPDLHCKILKRIVFKDKVIDHELVTANGNTFKAVAVYEIKNGKIVSVTFM
ncbi:nuclear transport factor 2 family protein [Polaribacter sp. Hel_I_88]|uniref:nuclear transport factor 2 family protein n=1 Tax=Polaribacter sp. Hel_I_88 TaxID=1250006 RepID=UPI000AC62E04|nr:nuclear transport factor 2 family protein [Polaribacter sp. Hel_I_88]